MDIRNYFSVLGGKKGSSSNGTQEASSSKTSLKKNKRVLADSNNDCLPPKKKQTIILSDSDDDDDFFTRKEKCDDKKINKSNKGSIKRQKKESPTKINSCSATSFFGAAPISRSSDGQKKKTPSEDPPHNISSTASSRTSDSQSKKTPSKDPLHDISSTPTSRSSDIQKKKTPSKDSSKDSSFTLTSRSSNSPRKKTPSKGSLQNNFSAPTTQSSGEQQKTQTKGSLQDDSSFIDTLEQLDKHHSRKRPKLSPQSNCNANQEVHANLKHKKPKLEVQASKTPDLNVSNPTGQNSLSSKVAAKLQKFSNQSDKNASKKALESINETKLNKIIVHDTVTNVSPERSNKSNEKSTSRKHSVSMATENFSTASISTPVKEAGDLMKNTTPVKAEQGNAPPLDEKKRQQSLAYRKYLQRAGPKNPGSKVIPEGAPECLAGLVFVMSGVLESLDRTEVTELVQRYGGRVVSAISGKTTHLLLGEDGGESKIAKAEQLGKKVISEDDFLDLIRDRPGSGSSKASTTSTPKGGKQSSADYSSAKKSIDKSLFTTRSTEKIHNTTKLESAVTFCGASSKQALNNLIEEASGSSQNSTQPLNTQELQQEGALMWVDKYKPRALKNIIGQQGDKSNAKKLRHWLINWTSNHCGNKKPVKPGYFAKDQDGSFHKSALLSGPPGVGKTTTAQVVCHELGFDTVELNASDTRSKRSLGEEVAQLLTNTSLSGFASGSDGPGTSRRRVLLMDEVDGMAGNEDRGGVQELIALLKTTRVPVICMCNDRNHPKIRSLANHCFDLRFYKPRVEQIRGAMMSVCFREGIKIKPDALDQIIIGSNQDVRQVLHHLSVFSAKDRTLQSEAVKKDANKARKDLKMGPWDVCRQVFTDAEWRNLTIHQKSDLFFHDYSIGPLFVQENYWKARPKHAKDRVALLRSLSTASNRLADGDLVERAIRSSNAWSLLPTQALFSCVLPGEAMAGHLSGAIEFPTWLGNNSKKNKMDRLAQEVHMHTRLRACGNKTDVALEYSRLLRKKVVQPLLRGTEGVQESVSAMEQYCLMREDLDSLGELSAWTGTKDHFSGLDSKVKAAFTRAFNKSATLNPYSAGAAPKKKKRGASGGGEDYGEDDAEEEDQEDTDDVSADSMIKVKKATNNTKGNPSLKVKAGKGKAKK